MHEIIVMEYENYTLTTILKPDTILDKAIEFHDMHFFKMIPNKKHLVLKYTCKK